MSSGRDVESQRRRSSKKKHKGDAVEFSDLLRSGKGKDKGDVDEFSGSLSELSISKSKNQGESSEEEDDEALKKLKEEIKKEYPGCCIVVVKDLDKRCGDLRPPEIVEQDPERKLLPKRKSGYNPFGIFESLLGSFATVPNTGDPFASICTNSRPEDVSATPMPTK